MLQQIPGLLAADQVAHCRARLEALEWDGGTLGEEHSLARELGTLIVQQLAGDARFTSAALPLKVFPPRFSRDAGGGTTGIDVDDAVRYTRQAPYRVRTDLSATLFLSDPGDYDGGELSVQDTYGAHRIKLAAGDVALHPAHCLHEVVPVTRGVRLAAHFWVQSMVRDDGQRTLLFEMDEAIQQLGRDLPEHRAVVALTGTYHNLLRRWAEL